MSRGFLPVTRKELEEKGIWQPDFVYISGDAYVDHPSFGAVQLGKSTLLKTLFHICDHFFSAVIGVKDLGSHRGGCLITDAAFQFYLADPHLGWSFFFLTPLAA